MTREDFRRMYDAVCGRFMGQDAEEYEAAYLDAYVPLFDAIAKAAAAEERVRCIAVCARVLDETHDFAAQNAMLTVLDAMDTLADTDGFSATLPTEPGLYHHRYTVKGVLHEQVLFVGYYDSRAPRNQGTAPNNHGGFQLLTCDPHEMMDNWCVRLVRRRGWWKRVNASEQTGETR